MASVIVGQPHLSQQQSQSWVNKKREEQVSGRVGYSAYINLYANYHNGILN